MIVIIVLLIPMITGCGETYQEKLERRMNECITTHPDPEINKYCGRDAGEVVLEMLEKIKELESK